MNKNNWKNGGMWQRVNVIGLKGSTHKKYFSNLSILCGKMSKYF